MSEVKKVETEADQIWEEIKDLPIGMFALANQTVKQHVHALPVPGKELLVKLVSTAALPALEETLTNRFGKKYEVDVAEGYVIVRKVPSQEEDIKKALASFIIAR